MGLNNYSLNGNLDIFIGLHKTGCRNEDSLGIPCTAHHQINVHLSSAVSVCGGLSTGMCEILASVKAIARFTERRSV